MFDKRFFFEVVNCYVLRNFFENPGFFHCVSALLKPSLFVDQRGARQPPVEHVSSYSGDTAT